MPATPTRAASALPRTVQGASHMWPGGWSCRSFVGLLVLLASLTLARAADPEKLTPPTSAELKKSIARGVKFLLEDQNKDGSWGSPRQTKGLNIFAPVPGAHHAFRAAVTAMCVEAL